MSASSYCSFLPILLPQGHCADIVNLTVNCGHASCLLSKYLAIALVKFHLLLESV